MSLKILLACDNCVLGIILAYRTSLNQLWYIVEMLLPAGGTNKISDPIKHDEFVHVVIKSYTINVHIFSERTAGPRVSMELTIKVWHMKDNEQIPVICNIQKRMNY